MLPRMWLKFFLIKNFCKVGTILFIYFFNNIIVTKISNVLILLIEFKANIGFEDPYAPGPLFAKANCSVFV